MGGRQGDDDRVAGDHVRLPALGAAFAVLARRGARLGLLAARARGWRAVDERARSTTTSSLAPRDRLEELGRHRRAASTGRARRSTPSSRSSASTSSATPRPRAARGLAAALRLALGRDGQLAAVRLRQRHRPVHGSIPERTTARSSLRRGLLRQPAAVDLPARCTTGATTTSGSAPAGSESKLIRHESLGAARSAGRGRLCRPFARLRPRAEPVAGSRTRSSRRSRTFVPIPHRDSARAGSWTRPTAASSRRAVRDGSRTRSACRVPAATRSGWRAAFGATGACGLTVARSGPCRARLEPAVRRARGGYSSNLDGRAACRHAGTTRRDAGAGQRRLRTRWGRVVFAVERDRRPSGGDRSRRREWRSLCGRSLDWVEAVP